MSKAGDALFFALLALANGGGGGSATADAFVGYVTNGDSFPTERPDGKDLQNGDYVLPDSTATFPFTIDGVLFPNSQTYARYFEESWRTFNPSSAIVEVTTLPTTDIDDTQFYYLTTATADYPVGIYQYRNGEWYWVDKDYSAGYYTELNKTGDYSADISYDDLNYDKANTYFAEHDTTIYGGCSSARNGNFIMSSFDWYYNNQVSFNVRAGGSGGKFRTWAQCGQMSELTKDFVNSKAYSEQYYILPFMVTVGGNQKGVTAQVLLMEQHGAQTAILPSGTVEYIISSNMVVRYIIDNFASAEQAIDYITTHVKVNMSAKLIEMGKSLHFVIADNTNTYILELVNGAYSVIDATDKPNKAVTNFGMTGVTPTNPADDDYSVYTPATQDLTVTPKKDAVTTNHVSEYGAGLERYNVAIENLDEVIDIDTAKAKLEALKYSKTYTVTTPTTAVWHTEFTSEEEALKVNSEPSAFATVETTARELWENKDRNDPKVWISKVQTVYDLKTGKVYVRYEEGTWQEKSFDIERFVTVDKFDILPTFESDTTKTPYIFMAEDTGIIYQRIKYDKVKASGLYETDTDTLIYTWEQLIDNNMIVVTDGVLTGGSEKTSMAGDLVIDTSITSIGDDAFYYCTSLTSIEIPNSVASIKRFAFYNCSSLTDFNYNGTTTQWGNITLGVHWKTNAPFTVVHCSDGDVNV